MDPNGFTKYVAAVFFCCHILSCMCRLSLKIVLVLQVGWRSNSAKDPLMANRQVLDVARRDLCCHGHTVCLPNSLKLLSLKYWGIAEYNE